MGRRQRRERGRVYLREMLVVKSARWNAWNRSTPDDRQRYGRVESFDDELAGEYVVWYLVTLLRIARDPCGLREE